MLRRLVGVGVGPGDPELVTVKAVRVLREADVVLVPVLALPEDSGSPPEPGRAETIIREYVDAGNIRRLAFALNDTGGITPRRAAAWRDAAEAVAKEFAGGATTIAFGTLGDPNLYSTFSYLAQTVRDITDVQIETIPGITAMQDLAARAGVSLAEGTEPVTLIPLNAGIAALDRALAHNGGAVVGYKLGAAASPPADQVRDRLAAAGRLDGAVFGARLGLPGEDIRPAADLASAPAVPYLSTLIVPPRRPGPASSLHRSGSTRLGPASEGSADERPEARTGSPARQPGSNRVAGAPDRFELGGGTR